ncbi:hypothetical protein K474DRAFT_622320 [Panus rudis PR-1116 ss-1]|nr:hypothetical protein K474DRAFT_622320 [Panus rudis PR-1116 ss-1]
MAFSIRIAKFKCTRSQIGKRGGKRIVGIIWLHLHNGDKHPFTLRFGSFTCAIFEIAMEPLSPRSILKRRVRAATIPSPTPHSLGNRLSSIDTQLCSHSRTVSWSPTNSIHTTYSACEYDRTKIERDLTHLRLRVARQTPSIQTRLVCREVLDNGSLGGYVLAKEAQNSPEDDLVRELAAMRVRGAEGDDAEKGKERADNGMLTTVLAEDSDDEVTNEVDVAAIDPEFGIDPIMHTRPQTPALLHRSTSMYDDDDEEYEEDTPSLPSFITGSSSSSSDDSEPVTPSSEDDDEHDRAMQFFLAMRKSHE